jgi:hypothetical protein
MAEARIISTVPPSHNSQFISQILYLPKTNLSFATKIVSKPLRRSIIIAIQFVVTMACGAMARHATVVRGAMVVPIMFADAFPY